MIRNPKSGFTLVEILVVLAIAALILLIVLLAVPMATRYSRNNHRKTDLSRYYARLLDYQSNYSKGIAPFPTGSAADMASFDNFTDNFLDDDIAQHYTFEKRNNNSPHDANPDPQKIIYFPHHYCSEIIGNPSNTVDASSHNTWNFAVLIGLEPEGQYFCLDNGKDNT
jgi:prepilin-type N-terminal cleavage/methylation domain-containing protein